jgi:hypothetical protein
MTLSDACALLASISVWDPVWYQSRYPDVAASGMDPALHYLRYGAAMGRDPAKDFQTEWYLRTYPDAAASGLNALVYHALQGRAAGHATCPPAGPDPRKQIATLRAHLLDLGFTDGPLRDLTTLAQEGPDPVLRAMAARELALWFLRTRKDHDLRRALDWLDQARAQTAPLADRTKLSIIEILCHFHLGDMGAGRAAYDRAALDGQVTADLLLARANLGTTPEARLPWINRVLHRHGIEPLALLPHPALSDVDLPAYDRLTCAVTLPKITDGPKVSVLIAAYDAADMLPTALRSLQEQTWANLEIIVLDDCSPTTDTMQVAERFAATDPRIQAVRMAQNGGAYVARNHGLDMATGDFVTLHDADDWSHPRKIETQVRFMMENAQVMGCTSEQARMAEDLTLPAVVHDGVFIHDNTSSLLFRKAPVQDRLGYWDRVRFSADSEFIRRMRLAFGPQSVRRLRGSPLSFQRTGPQSVMADPLRGMSDFLFGARREYLAAQTHAHSQAHSQGRGLKYANDPAKRPFPAPGLMCTAPERDAAQPAPYRLDHVLATDFRYDGPRLRAAMDDLRAWRARGLSCAVYELNDPDGAPIGQPFRAAMQAEIRDALWQQDIRILTYGERAICAQLVIYGTPDWQAAQRYLPAIVARETLFL